MVEWPKASRLNTTFATSDTVWNIWTRCQPGHIDCWSETHSDEQLCVLLLFLHVRTEVPSPGIAAFIGFESQAKLARPSLLVLIRVACLR